MASRRSTSSACSATRPSGTTCRSSSRRRRGCSRGWRCGTSRRTRGRSRTTSSTAGGGRTRTRSRGPIMRPASPCSSTWSGCGARRGRSCSWRCTRTGSRWACGGTGRSRASRCPARPRRSRRSRRPWPSWGRASSSGWRAGGRAARSSGSSLASGGSRTTRRADWASSLVEPAVRHRQEVPRPRFHKTPAFWEDHRRVGGVVHEELAAVPAWREDGERRVPAIDRDDRDEVPLPVAHRRADRDGLRARSVGGRLDVHAHVHLPGRAADRRPDGVPPFAVVPADHLRGGLDELAVPRVDFLGPHGRSPREGREALKGSVACRSAPVPDLDDDLADVRVRALVHDRLDRVRDVLRPEGPFRVGTGVVLLPPAELRDHVPGGDVRDLDAVRVELLPPAFVHPAEGPLRADVRGAARDAHVAHDGPDVHDLPALLPPHLRHRGAGEVERSEDVHLELLPHRRLGQLLEGRVVADPRVVHEHVEPAPRVDDRLHGRGREVRLPHVPRDREGLPPAILDRRGDLLQPVLPPGDEPDPHPLGTEPECDRPPDPARRARHERHAALRHAPAQRGWALCGLRADQRDAAGLGSSRSRIWSLRRTASSQSCPSNAVRAAFRILRTSVTSWPASRARFAISRARFIRSIASAFVALPEPATTFSNSCSRVSFCFGGGGGGAPRAGSGAGGRSPAALGGGGGDAFAGASPAGSHSIPVASSADARLRSTSRMFRSFTTSRARSFASFSSSDLRVCSIVERFVNWPSCSFIHLLNVSMRADVSSSRRWREATRSFWSRMKSSCCAAMVFSRPAIDSPIFVTRSRLSARAASRLPTSSSPSPRDTNFAFASASLAPTSSRSDFALSWRDSICCSVFWRAFDHSFRRLSSPASFSWRS